MQVGEQSDRLWLELERHQPQHHRPPYDGHTPWKPCDVLVPYPLAASASVTAISACAYRFGLVMERATVAAWVAIAAACSAGQQAGHHRRAACACCSGLVIEGRGLGLGRHRGRWFLLADAGQCPGRDDVGLARLLRQSRACKTSPAAALIGDMILLNLLRQPRWSVHGGRVTGHQSGQSGFVLLTCGPDHAMAGRSLARWLAHARQADWGQLITGSARAARAGLSGRSG